MKKQINLSKELDPMQLDMILHASSVNIMVNNLRHIHKNKKIGLLTDIQIKTLEENLHAEAVNTQAVSTFNNLTQLICCNPTETAVLICALIERIENKPA